MPVLFDAESGRLRLDDDSFETLSQWAHGQPTAGDVAPLRQAGVIDRGRPHEKLLPGLLAVSEPVCTVEITVEGEKLETGRGWVCAEAAALLLDLPGGLKEFVTVHPSFLPAALARIVRLGPRPRISALPLQIPHSTLDQLLSPEPEVRSSTVEKLIVDAPAGEREPTAAAATALGSGLRQQWRVRVEWAGPDGSPGGRGVRVLDTEAGLWLMEPSVGLAVIWPTTPTAIWRALVCLLPQDNEIG
ncbi:hypothetical protein GCM10009765_16530 [Fodinicola feengrottensis]|uniref:ESX secretion-associated protein EspG n=1 Tax=Fodinicola feengrottensis TaxID=435914 RepID=A0ABP4SCZ8_9ACTN